MPGLALRAALVAAKALSFAYFLGVVRCDRREECSARRLRGRRAPRAERGDLGDWLFAHRTHKFRFPRRPYPAGSRHSRGQAIDSPLLRSRCFGGSRRRGASARFCPF